MKPVSDQTGFNTLLKFPSLAINNSNTVNNAVVIKSISIPPLDSVNNVYKAFYIAK